MKEKDILTDENNYYLKTNKEENAENSKKNNKKTQKNRKLSQKGLKGAVIGLSIATGILGATTIGFGIGYGVTQSQADDYGHKLEAVYQKSFFDLVDSVNNAEIKLSKVLNSSTPSYQKKLMTEISQNATTAEASIASLPLSQNDINENVRMVNQISGYTATLADKLSTGQSLTQDERETLQDVYDNILSMKVQLNKIARKIQNGYNILEHSLDLNAKDGFSYQMTQIHDVDIEYPTMIYDGPFSDSVTNASVKGLSGSKVSKEDADKVIKDRFKNVVSLYFDGETNGRFQTYNFRLKNSDEEKLYVQVSQIGGHILTVSGAGDKQKEKSLQEDDAKKLALEFAKANGIENPEVVWQDVIANDIYFNIAPVSNGIVLYPDLVKIKMDLGSGTIIGYDATTYFTNHTKRTLGAFTQSFDEARNKIPSSLTVVGERKVLAPLDYNREVLCLEFECINSEDTYYIYVNADTGEEENILKVVKTDDGNKLL